MNKRIQSHKLFICERHFAVDQIYVYSSRKSLKEGALPTLNLPRSSANANATNNRSKRAIEKREEYALLQQQMPQSKTYLYLSKKKLLNFLKHRLVMIYFHRFPDFSVKAQMILVLSSANF